MLKDDDLANTTNHHLSLHRIVIFATYVLATVVATKVILLPGASENGITVLSTGAILATFGSAISTLGQLWCGDYAARILLNVDILYKDIFRADSWRRWPFLPRGGTRKLLSGNLQSLQLRNPPVSLNVGTHHIELTFPTVRDDFFDLPLIKHVLLLLKFRHAARTLFTTVPDKTLIVGPSILSPHDEYMAYECLLDIWTGVFIYRAARYVVHFGAALAISSAVLTAVAMAAVVA